MIEIVRLRKAGAVAILETGTDPAAMTVYDDGFRDVWARRPDVLYKRVVDGDIHRRVYVRVGTQDWWSALAAWLQGYGYTVQAS